MATAFTFLFTVGFAFYFLAIVSTTSAKESKHFRMSYEGYEFAKMGSLVMIRDLSLDEMLILSPGFKALYQRLGQEYFKDALITTIEGLYIIDYVGPLEKEIQILIDFQGFIVGINRAIYDKQEQLLDYVSIP